MNDPLVPLDLRAAHAGPLLAPCPSCGSGLGISCVVEVQALPGDVRPGTTRLGQVPDFHQVRVTASPPRKRFNGLGVEHYVEEVLSILDDFPDGPTGCYGAASAAEVEQAARAEFERAERVEDLEYSHVMFPS